MHDTLLYWGTLCLSFFFHYFKSIFHNVSKGHYENSVGGGEPMESYHLDMQLQLDCTCVIPDMSSSILHSQTIRKTCTQPLTIIMWSFSSPLSHDPNVGRRKEYTSSFHQQQRWKSCSHPSQIGILIRKRSHKVVAIGAHTLPLTVCCFSFLGGVSVPGLCLWLYF